MIALKSSLLPPFPTTASEPIQTRSHVGRKSSILVTALGKGAFDQTPKLPVVEIVTRDGVTRRSQAAEPEPVTAESTGQPPAESARPSLTEAENKREWAKQKLAELKKATNPSATPEKSGGDDGAGKLGPAIAALMVSKRKEQSRYANLVQPMEKPKEMPEVEIVRGQAPPPVEEVAGTSDQNEEMYRPRVSTWGVFPRPQNISETFGGGRTVRPGQKLLTEEEEKERAVRTAKLLEEFNKKAGLSMDPEIKQAAQQSLKKGQRLMDSGRLSEAIEQFERVMDLCIFKTEQHGEACLQKAICLDSLGRSTEAKPLYEKMGRHPNATFKKMANRMLFGFIAAESLKVSSTDWYDANVYRKYFNRFADGYNTMWTPTKEEEASSGSIFQELLPYTLLFLAPLLLVAVFILSRT